MPILQVHMLAGRDRETRRELIARLTETTCLVLDVEPECVRVELIEVTTENWGVAGVPLADGAD